MNTRKEYLQTLQETPNENRASGGVTVETTIGNKTTIVRPTQNQLGSVRSSFGNFRGVGEQRVPVPEGTFVNGAKLEAKEVGVENDLMLHDDMKSSSSSQILTTPSEIFTRGIKTKTIVEKNTTVAALNTNIGCLDFGNLNVPDGSQSDEDEISDEDIYSSTSHASQSQVKNQENVSSSTTKIIEIIGNKRIEAEIKKGESFTLQTVTGPNENYIKLNEKKINLGILSPGVMLQNDIKSSHPSMGASDFSNAPRLTKK